jgi:uncharacterized membrane protein YraQ (UPF0718 family)
MTNKKQQQNEPTIKKVFINSLKNFISISPMIVAVIGLIGLFQTYVTETMLSQLFGYNDTLDVLIGTLVGAISSGNGAVSFVIAKGLGDQGVSLYALSAFILSWVTLSFVHLPAESSVFGVKFTTYRNVLTLLSTILVAYLTAVTVGSFA